MVDESITIATPAAPARDKVRIRFRKDSSQRWLSHHDLMRTLERLLRRAELPVHCTQGFNPHPRLVFALSLPLGVVGCEEVLELELDQTLPLEEIHERLCHQAPAGLTFLSLQRVSPRAQAQVRRLSYRLPIPDDRCAALQARIDATLAATECPVERQRPTVRCVNIRPFLSELKLQPHGVLEMTLWLRPEGTARPEEVLRLLDLNDLTAAGAILERFQLELHDEANGQQTLPDKEASQPTAFAAGSPIKPPLTQPREALLPGETLAGTEADTGLPFIEKEEHEERDAN